MENIFGSLSMVLVIAMVVIALPSQIYKNYKEKKCGLSFLMIVLPLSIYITRGFYAVFIKSWYILIPDSIGVVVIIIILIQYILYRKNQPAS